MESELPRMLEIAILHYDESDGQSKPDGQLNLDFMLRC